MSKAVDGLVKTISATLAIESATGKIDGRDLMLALATVSLVAHQLYAEDLQDEAVASLFDMLAMAFQPDPQQD